MTAAARRTAVLLGAALAAWAITVARVRGMGMGPGTDLGGFGWYLGVWVTMTAAMMLPSAAPMIVLFADAARGSARTFVFVASYLVLWTGFGLVAYALARGLRAVGVGFDHRLAGAAIVAAGLYEATPLKHACLHRCRTPLGFIVHRWRNGAGGALRMGAEHGSFCIGCCAGLMLVLFALGVMSVFWMAVVAAVIAAQKLLPFGDRLVRPLAAALVVGGATLALAG